jgi:ribonuclease Z
LFLSQGMNTLTIGTFIMAIGAVLGAWFFRVRIGVLVAPGGWHRFYVRRTVVRRRLEAVARTVTVMFELVFLGTSASAPSVQRGLSAAMLMHREYRFLIDCGEGTQRQILRSGLGFKRLERVLLTHGHLDHILGLGGLASTFGRWETLEEMEIWGGQAALSRVRDLMRVVFGAAEAKVNIGYRVIEPGVLLEDDIFRVRAFPVEHRRTEAFGYSFEEKPRRPFLPEKAAVLGVPFGPIRRDLVAGLPVTLEDGQTISAG